MDRMPGSQSSFQAIPTRSRLSFAIRRNSSSAELAKSGTATKTKDSAPTDTNKGIRRLSIADTPLGPSNEEGSSLLTGLDVYDVPSQVDGHSLAVYGIKSKNVDFNASDKKKLRPMLLCHGRTWSSVPVYHLLGGMQSNKEGFSRSLMESLLETRTIQPYMMDFRGFGGTPRDATGQVTPHICVHDVESVLQWIAKKHGVYCTEASQNKAPDHDCASRDMPVLLGWSQGALVTQLVAQRSPHLLSKLVLYGSIYDPMVRYARAPIYTITPIPNSVQSSDERATSDSSEIFVANTYEAAIEDFTVEGTIAPEPAQQFAHAALLADPIKAKWAYLHEFNNLDPARVHVPTLVVAGDQDPYAPLRAQQELFCGLGRGADRSWTILSGADHAVHLLDSGKERFVSILKHFVETHQPSSPR